MQEQLQKCQGLIANDYFLAEVKDTFTEQARMAVFEVYCRIHQRINLDALATQVRATTPPTHPSLPALLSELTRECTTEHHACVTRCRVVITPGDSCVHSRTRLPETVEAAAATQAPA